MGAHLRRKTFLSLVHSFRGTNGCTTSTAKLLESPLKEPDVVDIYSSRGITFRQVIWIMQLDSQVSISVRNGGIDDPHDPTTLRILRCECKRVEACVHGISGLDFVRPSTHDLIDVVRECDLIRASRLDAFVAAKVLDNSSIRLAVVGSHSEVCAF